MRLPLPLTTLIACALLVALPAAPAHANDNRILNDCQTSDTGVLRGSYSKSQLNHALDNIPGDILEYSGCYDAIRGALHASAGGGNGGGNDGGDGGGGTGGLGGAAGGSGNSGGGADGLGATGTIPDAPPPVGAEQPVEIAGTSVAPGALPEIGHDSRRLPTTLLVLFVLLALAALMTAALTIGRRVVARRRA